MVLVRNCNGAPRRRRRWCLWWWCSRPASTSLYKSISSTVKLFACSTFQRTRTNSSCNGFRWLLRTFCDTAPEWHREENLRDVRLVVGFGSLSPWVRKPRAFQKMSKSLETVGRWGIDHTSCILMVNLTTEIDETTIVSICWFWLLWQTVFGNSMNIHRGWRDLAVFSKIWNELKLKLLSSIEYCINEIRGTFVDNTTFGDYLDIQSLKNVRDSCKLKSGCLHTSTIWNLDNPQKCGKFSRSIRRCAKFIK